MARPPKPSKQTKKVQVKIQEFAERKTSVNKPPLRPKPKPQAMKPKRSTPSKRNNRK